MSDLTPAPTSRTLKVTWAPEAIRTAVDRARAIVAADSNTVHEDVYEFPGGFLTLTDLCALVDADRQFLNDDTDAPKHGDIRSVRGGSDQVYLDGRGADDTPCAPAGWYEIGAIHE